MPGGDGTGPMGDGPMTGRGMGFCIREVGGQTSGFFGRLGRFFGGGRGRGGFGARGGRGRRNMFRSTGLYGWQRAAQANTAGGVDYADAQADDDRAMLSSLEQESQALSQALEQINRRIAELHSKWEAEGKIS